MFIIFMIGVNDEGRCGFILKLIYNYCRSLVKIKFGYIRINSKLERCSY